MSEPFRVLLVDNDPEFAALADAHRWEIDLAEGTEGGARFEFTGVETT